MAKARVSTTWGTKLNITWVVLGISLLVNAVLISTFVYLESWRGDKTVVRTGIEHACVRDFDRTLSTFTTDEQKILFAEGVCHRNFSSGSNYTLKVVNGHFTQQ